ncbi:MAG: PLP-dependent transferase [bacterium]
MSAEGAGGSSAADLRPETLAVTAGRPEHRPGAPVNPAIDLSVTYRTGGEHEYLRESGSGTTRAFEAAIGALEGGSALAFASGMGAIAAVVEGLPVGTVAVVPSAGYSGMMSIFPEQERLGRLTARRVDVDDTDAVCAALDGADVLWLESPTNPLLQVADLPALTAAAHAVGATVYADATFTSPVVLRPLEHGVDVVMHSATKYISGHSDLLMGVLVTASAEHYAALCERRTLTGGMPGALESFLALRGLRTLPLRMQRSQETAGELARRLEQHPAVARVRYPGLPTDPGHERATRLQDGYGAILCFELAGGAAAADAVCDGVRVITAATSLGGVESLIERRARYPVDAASGTPPELLRLSVGIEHVEDLWTDLARALYALG